MQISVRSKPPRTEHVQWNYRWFTNKNFNIQSNVWGEAKITSHEKIEIDVGFNTEKIGLKA